MAERLAARRVLMGSDAGADYASEEARASLGSRVLAFIVDSAVLFGFSMAFATAAFLVIFLGSDTGQRSITDAQQWLFLGIFIGTAPAWLVFNLLLGLKLGQTVGHFVLGLRIVDEQGQSPSPRRLVGYWFALHPLLFHPVLALPWLMFAFLGVALAENEYILVGALAVALLCLVAPLAALVFALLDPQRRTIHDRLAGLRVVRL